MVLYWLRLGTLHLCPLDYSAKMPTPGPAPPVIVIDSVDEESTDNADEGEIKSDVSQEAISQTSVSKADSNNKPVFSLTQAKNTNEQNMPSKLVSDKSSSSSLTVPILTSPNGSLKDRRRHGSKEEELRHLTEDVS